MPELLERANSGEFGKAYFFNNHCTENHFNLIQHTDMDINLDDAP